MILTKLYLRALAFARTNDILSFQKRNIHNEIMKTQIFITYMRMDVLDAKTFKLDMNIDETKQWSLQTCEIY